MRTSRPPSPFLRPLPERRAALLLHAFALALTLLSGSLLRAQDAALLEAEAARGILTGNQGVQWTVTVTGSRDARFLATSQGGRIFAEVLEPEESVGSRYLAEAKGDMWFWKPGVSRPVSISRRQRLTGDAAIGDIASTSFVEGYRVTGQEPTELNGEKATIYTMEATGISDTYAKIRYWVVAPGNLGKKAEFYARSGNLVRTSTMEYGNSVNGRPFLSRMVIQDGSRTLTLTFSKVQLGSFPASMFTRENLGGPRSKGPRR